MAAEFDEYALLDQQLEGKKGRENGHRSDRHKDKRSSGDKDQDRKHKREHRSKSRDRDRRHGHSSRHGDEDREKKRHKHKTRSRSREHRVREKTPPEVREARERERELKELDRDIRTVFAYNLNLKADERDLFEFFSSAGQVEDVRIIMDRNTRKSKGFAYIEYTNRESIVTALALTGQTLMGQAVMVKSSEAEKNLAWEAAQQQQSTLAQMNALAVDTNSGPCKLYVGSLHVNITEADLKQIFEPFGAVDFIMLQKDMMGQSQGHAFVQYKAMVDAMKAMQQLDGMEIAGARIVVKVAALTPAEAAGAALNAGVDLDDDEDQHGGLKLTANARAALMSRLAGAAGMPAASGPGGVPLGAAPGPPSMALPGMVPPGMIPGMVAMGGALPGPPSAGMAGVQAAPAPAPAPAMSAGAQALALVQGMLGPASPIPTPCLLLKNMFDPAEETEPNWDEDIAADVKEECQKFGQVLHVHVDKASKGFMYLKFAAVDGASAAQKGLHGRWFAGRQVVAEFQFAQPYSQFFRC